MRLGRVCNFMKELPNATGAQDLSFKTVNSKHNCHPSTPSQFHLAPKKPSETD